MAANPIEILIFEIEGRRYGLPVTDVQELLRAVTVTPLPHAPSVLEGVINLRGQIVPVLDLRGHFNLPARPIEPSDHLIVARPGSRRVALRVDRAMELVRLNDVDAVAADGMYPGAACLGRVAKLADGLVFIPDLLRLLSQAEAAGLPWGEDGPP